MVILCLEVRESHTQDVHIDIFCLVFSFLAHIIFTSIWVINGTLKSTTTLGQSGRGSNGIERIPHTPWISRCSWASYKGQTFFEGRSPSLLHEIQWVHPKSCWMTLMHCEFIYQDMHIFLPKDFFFLNRRNTWKI